MITYACGLQSTLGSWWSMMTVLVAMEKKGNIKGGKMQRDHIDI